MVCCCGCSIKGSNILRVSINSYVSISDDGSYTVSSGSIRYAHFNFNDDVNVSSLNFSFLDELYHFIGSQFSSSGTIETFIAFTSFDCRYLHVENNTANHIYNRIAPEVHSLFNSHFNTKFTKGY